ncbi:HNH endonuclease [Salmonella enterica subsp. enterica serovar Cerro]|nr:HNH endonuclease [Salmonella enterica subsp. enterica serovar Cerro]
MVRQRFVYENGKLLYRHKAGRMPVGASAGTKHRKGYVQININGKFYQRSRLVWEYHNGPIPEGFEVDHINAVRDDDRIENLQLISHRDNVLKGGIQTGRSHNKSGFTGVFWNKQRNKYQAGITIDGVYIYLGLYPTAQEASLARKRYEKEVDWILLK